MRRKVIGSFIASALLVSGSRTWAQERTWITITAAGTERGGCGPRDMPKGGTPNTYMPGGDHRNLARRDFATYLVRPDKAQPIAEMSALRIPPMVLRSVVRSSTPR